MASSLRRKKLVFEHEPDENNEVEENVPCYTLVITGNIKCLEEGPPEQAIKRGFFKKEVFLKRYRFGNTDEMSKLIHMAEFYCVKTHPERQLKHDCKQQN